MAGLYDIGSSGIQAYRKALSVTGQNIANLNTEGYRRREASMEEISATQGGILSVSDQVGLGVRVSDISRAFDGFIAARARDRDGQQRDGGMRHEGTGRQECFGSPCP